MTTREKPTFWNKATQQTPPPNHTTERLKDQVDWYRFIWRDHFHFLSLVLSFKKPVNKSVRRIEVSHPFSF